MHVVGKRTFKNSPGGRDGGIKTKRPPSRTCSGQHIEIKIDKNCNKEQVSGLEVYKGHRMAGRHQCPQAQTNV